MSEEQKGMSRRQFAKVAGATVAAAALIHPGNAAATTLSPANRDSAFEFALANFMPMRGEESSLVKSKNGIKFYRNAYDLRHDKHLELNGMASITTQLCNGRCDFENLLYVLQDVYGVSKESLREPACNYIKFLFEEGFVCFVSEKLLSEPEKRRRSGLTLHNKTDREIKVISKFGKKVDQIF